MMENKTDPCCKGFSTLYARVSSELGPTFARSWGQILWLAPVAPGKSTFLKLLDGSLEPTYGFVRRHAKLQLARRQLRRQNSLGLRHKKL